MNTVIVAMHEIRLRVRDRSVLLLSVVAPFVLASIMGFAFGGTSTDHVTLGLVDVGHSAIDVPTSSTRSFVREPNEASARAAVKAGKVGAAIILPLGFAAGRVPALVIGHRDRSIAEAAATSVARQLSDRVGGVAERPARVVEDRGLADSSPLGFFGPSMAIL